eukprot:721162-Pyramimonas_sp.AAC.1
MGCQALELEKNDLTNLLNQLNATCDASSDMLNRLADSRCVELLLVSQLAGFCLCQARSRLPHPCLLTPNYSPLQAKNDRRPRWQTACDETG